jgi:putative ABC transport system ATP-binding protein
MSLVTAENVTRTYRMGEVEIHALSDVQLEIEEGTFVSFVGPSGSGKTTLLNLIGGLDRPTSGRLMVSGVDVSTLNPWTGARFRRDTIGFVFQDFNLLPVLTAFENVEYPLVMAQRRPTSERRRTVQGLLEAVGMADQAGKRPGQLSGGQRQRVAIARALVTGPRLVLADEPTANLDHETGSAVMQVMKGMQRERGTTFIFSTHDTRLLNEAETLYSLEDGRLVDRRASGERRS